LPGRRAGSVRSVLFLTASIYDAHPDHRTASRRPGGRRAPGRRTPPRCAALELDRARRGRCREHPRIHTRRAIETKSEPARSTVSRPEPLWWPTAQSIDGAGDDLG